MVQGEGVIAARTLGEARKAIDVLELLNWVPASPRKLVKGVKVKPYVLLVNDFDATEPILASIRVAAGNDDLTIARVVLL